MDWLAEIGDLADYARQIIVVVGGWIRAGGSKLGQGDQSRRALNALDKNLKLISGQTIQVQMTDKETTTTTDRYNQWM